MKTIRKIAKWAAIVFVVLIAALIGLSALINVLDPEGMAKIRAEREAKEQFIAAASNKTNTSKTAAPTQATTQALPAPTAAATADAGRTNPTEEDKAKAREIARQIARGRMIRIAEDVDVAKAMERRSKYGNGLTIEEQTAAYADEYPAGLQEWFCTYVPPVVKRIMIATSGIAEKHGADGVRRFFMVLKDYPEDLKAWAFEAHHGAAGALKDPLANEEAFDYLVNKWVVSYTRGHEEEYKTKSQSQWLADVKASCTDDAAEAYPKNKTKHIECAEKLYKAVYNTLEKRGLVKPEAAAIPVRKAIALK
jgi:hypothetical protein